MYKHKLCIKENKEFDETINPDYPLTTRGATGFKESIENNNALAIVAEVDGEIVGYLAGGVVESEDYRMVNNIYEAGSMWVEETHRSKGIGAGLLDRFESWAKEKGATRLRATASAQNKRAIELYKKEGFQEYDLILEKRL